MASVAGDQSPEANGNKRKSEDGSAQGRAKRNRYISIACNECKRRKIKCNGQMPCQRCGNLNLECVYAPNCCAANFRDSEEFKKMSAQISSLQDQIDVLYNAMNSFRSELDGNTPQIDPALQQQSIVPHRDSFSADGRPRNQSMTAPRPPTFRGPTSTEFNLGVAKNSLQTMGIDPTADEALATRDASPNGTPPPEVPTHVTKDPIWSVSREEALRLVHVYEDEMHEMYPIVTISEVIKHTNSVYTFMEAALRNKLAMRAMPGTDAINDEDTNVLKLIMAISMVVEGSGRSELGQRLHEFVRPSVDGLLLGNAGFTGTRLLALVAIYEFHCDNEGTSWRVIGLTTRLCIELGLHRKETYDAMSDQDRDTAVLLFWAIYCLDRRWSFGTGMPFALQDTDIDPNLPKPNTTQAPYLKAMIDHFGIASKVWHAIGSDSSASPNGTISKQEVEYLDFQIMSWHRKLPDHLRYEHSSAGRLETDPAGLRAYRFRVILYLRGNNMRIHLYRPVLHSVTSIMGNRAQAQTAVDVAKDSIRMLTHINQTTKMYHVSQVLFNAFMVSALAVLFLAVAHAPVEFADQVREEFYMALDLVRGFARGSYVSKRLWKTIRVLKEIGPKLGLSARNQSGLDNSQHSRRQAEDPNRSAALAMAGLAGHNVDETALYGNHAWGMGSVASNSPDVMVHELTNIFEATAGAYQNGYSAGMNGNGGYSTMATPHGLVDGTTPGMDVLGFGNEDELSRILRDLF